MPCAEDAVPALRARTSAAQLGARGVGGGLEGQWRKRLSLDVPAGSSGGNARKSWCSGAANAPRFSSTSSAGASHAAPAWAPRGGATRLRWDGCAPPPGMTFVAC
jgi:hypothetical protein